MFQAWNFFCLDKRECIYPDQFASRLQLGDFFNDGITNKAIAGRITPLGGLPKIPRISTKDADVLKGCDEESRCFIFRLPNEILISVAKRMYAESIEDTICLGATCHTLWEICSPLIERWGRGVHTWAGARIACVGELTQDLPIGSLTTAEQAAFEAANPHDPNATVMFYPYAMARYWEVQPGHFDPGRRPLYLYESLRNERRVDGAPLAAVELMLKGFTRGSEVLRNLSKKQYVRADTIEELNQTLQEHPDLPKYTLGDALVSRICWSSNPSCAMPHPPNDFTRGPWAFDTFDITAWKELEGRPDFGEWVDVSEKVCEVLKQCRGPLARPISQRGGKSRGGRPLGSWRMMRARMRRNSQRSSEPPQV